ncbi:hypothetical protein H6P81_007166 [Aristolochia fimbriata]|uniref:NAD-dependent epimerase/dehydratase domain-containing protein n=1 Tax=Aristolochia fimbriata TaxID=158543 RepID=A0AAV7F385_ARIFI|nr:hypothetical protein H6P81_007166 [Aristolochia fimbriata]
MATETTKREKVACVTGASGYLASLLVNRLLGKGYIVNGTVRDPGNHAKVSHLLNLPGAERLKLFPADLTVECSFDDPINGCDLVFHVATPVRFDSEDPESEMIKPALEGTLNVLRACARTKTAKPRVVLTSSAAAVSIHREQDDDRILTEECWTDAEFLFTEKPPSWGYPVSKTVAEKEAWKFAEENQIDLISVVPVLISGPSLTPHVPNSAILALSLLRGDDVGLKAMQMASGSISLVHVHDVCEAHVFLAEKESASGRYICCAVNTSVPELAKFLSERYPEYNVPTNFGDFPAKNKYSLSSEKLLKEGFTFKFGIEEIYDQSVEYYLKAKGLVTPRKGLQSIFGKSGMATETKKTACVTGANGYTASVLVKQLLDKGYVVHGTVRDPGNPAKVSHLLNLPGAERLKLFQSDLTVEGSFDDPINGCDFVFHVAAPLLFDSKDPENYDDPIKPTIQGTMNVLRSCAKATTVKRVVLTSSTAAVSVHRPKQDGGDGVITEDSWTDVEYLIFQKPTDWVYTVSKTLTEKEAWNFAAENQMDLISIAPVLETGPSPAPHVPKSAILLLSLLTAGNYNGAAAAGLKAHQLSSGSISLVHVHDVCRAHIFLAEKESASGRYICSAVDTSVLDLAKFLSNRYPQYNVPTDFGDFPSKSKYTLSSEKLVKEGFTFKFAIEEIYDESVEYFKAKGLLPN